MFNLLSSLIVTASESTGRTRDSLTMQITLQTLTATIKTMLSPYQLESDAVKLSSIKSFESVTAFIFSLK